MLAGHGEWVIRDGVRVRESKLDRGCLLFTTTTKMRSHQVSLILILSLPIWVLCWGIIIIVEQLSSSSLTTTIDSLIGVAIFNGMLVVTFIGIFAVIYGIMMTDRFMPGIYENGIEPIYPIFVPYEEIASTSYRNRSLGRMLIIHVKGSKRKFTLPLSVIGADWRKYVEARVREQAETAGSSPRT